MILKEREKPRSDTMRYATVELFCGIGGFHIACDSLNVKTLWANDISPKSCRVYRDNFGGDVLVEGDIRKVAGHVPPHDLLTAGFPCQPFSSAGQKKGIHDPRGTLFLDIVDILKRRSPKYFVLENVRRVLSMQKGSHFATILAELARLDYFIEWRIVNGAWLGLAQNRERVFIVGTRADMTEGIPCIKLADNRELETFLREKYDMLMNCENWRKISRHEEKFPFWGVAFHGRFTGWTPEFFSETKPLKTLASVLQQQADRSFDYTEETLERIKKSTFVNKFQNGVRILYNQGGGARMGYTVFGTDGIASTLTASTSRHYERYEISGRYRRLTNVEYARLQGFPDHHCKAVSVYDQYALYGNAVPPPMAGWVIQKLLSRGNTAFRRPLKRQLSLFEGEI
ncbi:DNA (cytosine-5-)-methyltransferase [Desulfobacterales bacterium HSG2]|nr:DNA (cytosine-5-)-methyltransferase [Desulfobacterales bacterium HSG2]